MRPVPLLVSVLLLAVCGAAADPPPKPADQLPAVAELPSPFVFADGSPVRTRADWDRRRAEIKRLFEQYEYGRMPPKPAKMTVKKGDRTADDANNVVVQKLDVTLENDGKTFAFPMTVVLPKDAKGPVPVVVQSTFFGFGKGKGGNPNARYKVYGDRGYAVAEFSWNAVAADAKGAKRGGVYTLFGDGIDTGTLMGWAWGVSRVIDALAEAVPEVDAAKAVVTGHSRNGKAALVAGAFDDRIALTVPSHSGTGGVPPYRFVEEFAKKHGKTEALSNIVGSFPHWFHPDFKQFVGNVDRLPVDQHLLVAVVAPRPLMHTEGLKDIWINPEGAQASNRAAAAVYKFLGAADKLSYRYRDVGHIPSTEDLLDYADHVFRARPLPPEFGKPAYPDEVKTFGWDVPK
jgi:endo-1,4-beta-xylanase